MKLKAYRKILPGNNAETHDTEKKKKCTAHYNTKRKKKKKKTSLKNNARNKSQHTNDCG